MSPNATEPKGWLGIMVKAPVLGRVKTRLAASRGDRFALEFAQACLQDVWGVYGRLDSVRTELILSGNEALPNLQPPPRVHPQDPGDLGARIEAALRFGLRGAPYAIVIGTDSPSLPKALVLEASERLRQGANAVIGPAVDGGFYLLGLRRCPDGLLRNLPWSQERTGQATTERLSATGMTPHMLPEWFDVDDEVGLNALMEAFSEPRPPLAPHCRALLRPFLPRAHHAK